MSKMPTVLHERRPGRVIGDDRQGSSESLNDSETAGQPSSFGWESGSMRIIPHVPLYQYSSYGNCWTRILMMEDGNYLKVALTPSNPTVKSEWEALREERILWSGRSLFRDTAAKDKITRELPAEVSYAMYMNLGSEVARRLLTDDLWAEVSALWPEEYERPYDITDWLVRSGYNGGIALANIQKNPPTHEERYAAAERKRNAEREERIAAAVGSAEPLNEAEQALGKSLEGHDWAYQYSDDGEVWRSGSDHKQELQRQLLALSAERRKIVWKAFVHPHNEEYWKCPE